MARVNDLLSKEVINYGGEIIGKITDVIFDKNKMNVILYIVATKKGLFKKYFLLKPNQINIVSDVIIVSSVENQISRVKYNIIKRASLVERIGNSVFSKDNKLLGSLKDIILNEKTGEIKALCLTNGAINDLIYGRDIVIVDKDTKFKSNCIVVDNDMKILNQATIKNLIG